MGLTLASIRGDVERADVAVAVQRLAAAWQTGRPDLEAVWAEHSAGPIPLAVLTALVKADLAERFARGEQPEAHEYLARFPALAEQSNQVLSLVYEEFCLREEHGARPDTAEFCERYAPWKDSLESQLKYHRALSRVAGSSPPPPPRFPVPGTTFAQFTIGRELGRGGAARVYLAHDNSLGGREVVLKVSADRGSEPQILGRLEHPNIIAVNTVARDVASGLRALCMPYRPGLPLDEVIRAVDPAKIRPRFARALRVALRTAPTGPDAPVDAASAEPGWVGFPLRGSYADGVAWIVATIAEALAYAHERNVVHRDVKPANVLLTYRYGPQLLDFNLSHDPHSPNEAEAALRGGTLPYMAPEQLEAFLDPSRWSDVLAPADIYSLGLLAREMLIGETPPTPDLNLSLPRAIRGLLDRRADSRRSLRSHNRSIPHALEAIVDRCLALAPAERYASAAELAEDLRLYLSRRPLRHATNRSPRELGTNWAYRRRRVLAASLVVVALFVGWIEPWRKPVASNPLFLQAVAEVEAKNTNHALDLLSRFDARDRNTPEIAFYEAVALAQAGKAPHALTPAKHALSAIDPSQPLGRWGRNHPALYEQAMYLGAYFCGAAEQDRDGRRTELFATAEKFFQWSLDHNPRFFLSRLGLAAIAENRGRYDQAQRMLDALAADSSGSPSVLRDVLHQSVRNALLWGKQQLPSDGGDDRAVMALLHKSLADFERAQGLGPVGAVASRFELNYVGVEVLFALADRAEIHRDRNAAGDFIRRAHDLLPDLRDHADSQEDLFRLLSDRIEKRYSEWNSRAAASNPPQVSALED